MAERDAVHGYFELTYANYLVLHRTVLQSMPQEWQTRFVRCLREMDEAARGLPRHDAYRVHPVGAGGRYVAEPIPHYNRGRERVPLRRYRRGGGRG